MGVKDVNDKGCKWFATEMASGAKRQIGNGATAGPTCRVPFMNDDSKNMLWETSVKINGVKMKLEIDIGAAHTILSKNITKKLFSGELP